MTKQLSIPAVKRVEGFGQWGGCKGAPAHQSSSGLYFTFQFKENDVMN